jgi:hypothetical protein
MVDVGFRVDEVLKILLYRKCNKYNLGRVGLDTLGLYSQRNCVLVTAEEQAYLSSLWHAAAAGDSERAGYWADGGRESDAGHAHERAGRLGHRGCLPQDRCTFAFTALCATRTPLCSQQK